MINRFGLWQQLYFWPLSLPGGAIFLGVSYLIEEKGGWFRKLSIKKKNLHRLKRKHLRFMYKKLKLKKGQYEMWKEEDDKEEEEDEEIKSLEECIARKLEKKERRNSAEEDDASLKQPLNGTHHHVLLTEPAKSEGKWEWWWSDWQDALLWLNDLTIHHFVQSQLL